MTKLQAFIIWIILAIIWFLCFIGKKEIGMLFCAVAIWLPVLLVKQKQKPKPQSAAEPVSETQSKYSGFDIEFLPHCNRYFPRYKGQYFYFWTTRKNYTLQDSAAGCQYGETEDEAKKIIDMYLETKGIDTKIITLE